MLRADLQHNLFLKNIEIFTEGNLEEALLGMYKNIYTKRNGTSKKRLKI